VTGPYAQAAQAYLTLGLGSPITIPYKRKKDPLPGWTGYDGARASGADVQEWADNGYGGHNIAIRLAEDVLCIDVDNYDGKPGEQTVLDAIEKLGPLPKTYVSTSRADDPVSGIRWYRTGRTGRAWADVLKKDGGVEILHWGHRYAMVEPSVHPEGRVYTWRAPDGSDDPPCYDDLPMLPQAWIDHLDRGPESDRPRAAEMTSEEVRTFLTALPAGKPCRTVQPVLDAGLTSLSNGASRHDSARNRIAELLRNGEQGHTGVNKALESLRQAFVTALAGERDRDPAHEFAAMVSGGVRLVQGKPTPDSDKGCCPEAPDPTILPDQTPAGADPAAEVDLLAEVRTGGWLNEQEFPPLKYAVPGLVPEGFSILSGPPKVGKSFLVLQFALAVARGGVVLDTIAIRQPRPVLYLALEDSDRRMQDRCRKLLQGEPIPDRFHYLLDVTPANLVPTMTKWLATDGHGHRDPLIVLDTLGKKMPNQMQGEGAYARDYRFGGQLKRCIDQYPGAALLASHHNRKASSADFVDTVSGTNGLAGSADTVLILTRERQSHDGNLKVTGRDVEENDYALTIDDDMKWSADGMNLAQAAQAAELRHFTEGLGQDTNDVLDLVEKAGPEGLRPADVVVKLDGFDSNKASTYLRRLRDKGKVHSPERGLFVALRYQP
jgi:RecA-family ATPase